MSPRKFKLASIIFICIMLIISKSNAQSAEQERHIEVALRMIGHQVLLNTMDSTSRVLPIAKENNSYRIQFETEFEFKPGELVATINRVVNETNLANSYIVEVEQCETSLLVYSYKMEDLNKSDIIPCNSRIQPKACYSLLFTLIETSWVHPIATSENSGLINGLSRNNSVAFLSIAAILLFIGVLAFLQKRKKNKRAINPNLIPLGAYHFDTHNTELIINHQRIELTSKEGDLLMLLYNEANTTVDRDIILNKVWGDEGDYVGRTLDVFISKLRKKLEFDSKLKIVNIRGVGYKLVMDV